MGVKMEAEKLICGIDNSQWNQYLGMSPHSARKGLKRITGANGQQKIKSLSLIDSSDKGPG